MKGRGKAAEVGRPPGLGPNTLESQVLCPQLLLKIITQKCGSNAQMRGKIEDINSCRLKGKPYRSWPKTSLKDNSIKQRMNHFSGGGIGCTLWDGEWTQGAGWCLKPGALWTKFEDKTGKESRRPSWDKMDGPSMDLIKTQEIKTACHRYRAEKIPFPSRYNSMVFW